MFSNEVYSWVMIHAIDETGAWLQGCRRNEILSLDMSNETLIWTCLPNSIRSPENYVNCALLFQVRSPLLAVLGLVIFHMMVMNMIYGR